MKTKIVLDSCVFNKLFLQEVDSAEAISLINELGIKKYQILAPSLFLYEVLAIAGANNFSIRKAQALIAQYQSANFQLVEINHKTIDKAIEICKTGHQKSGFPSFYDASYHALAIMNECNFITADKRHISKTAQFGHIVLLENWQVIFD